MKRKYLKPFGYKHLLYNFVQHFLTHLYTIVITKKKRQVTKFGLTYGSMDRIIKQLTINLIHTAMRNEYNYIFFYHEKYI